MARHEATAEERDRDAEGEAESYLPAGGAENEREDVVAVGAESHAQADFAGAARDRVGSDAVQADGGQHESEQSKQRSEAADEAFLIEISGDLVVESFEIEDREIGIDIRERVANEWLEAGGVSGIAKSDRVGKKGAGFRSDGAAFLDRGVQLRHGTEVHRPHGLAGIVVLGIGDDPDDLVVAGVLPIEGSEVVSDGIFVGKEFLDEGLIDDCHHARGGGVLISEAAAAKHGLADGFKEMRTDAVPRGTILGFWPLIGPALYTDTLAPVIAFERAVEGNAYALDAGKS